MISKTVAFLLSQNMELAQDFNSP